MKVAILRYIELSKGNVSVVDVETSSTIGELLDYWKIYFHNPNLKVYKFQISQIKKAYSGNPFTSYFEENTTIQEYIDFYSEQNMKLYPYVILL